jgi:adenosylhomocysteine nucleosidase
MRSRVPGSTDQERIGVVIALPAEARPLATAQASGFEILISGPGPARAAEGATLLVDRGVHSLLSWGTSGALRPDLRAGRLILATEVHDDSGRQYASDARWLTRAAAALAALEPVRAPCATVPQPVASVQEKQALAARTGCAAVDMEAAAVAAVAAAHGLPFLAVRSIVDPADCELPRCVLASLRPTGATDMPALLAALLRRPWELGGLIRLALHFDAALRSLRRAAGLLPRIETPVTGHS